MTILSFYAALLSKPTALSFPIVLMLIDYYEDRELTWKLLSNKIPLFIGSIAAGILGLYIIQQVDVMAKAPEGYNFIEIISLAAFALAFYIYSVLVPFSLSNFHSYPHQIDGSIETIYFLSPLFLIALAYLLYRLWPKYDKLIFGFAFFLIIIGPTWRLVPTGYPIVADRYFYLASIGIIFFLVNGVASIGEKIKLSREIALSFTLAPLCFIFFFKTQNRVADWKNSITLWESALAEDPTLHNAYNHLAIAYDEFGNDERALMFYEKALNENPNLPEILNSAGVIYFESNQHKKALEYFNKAIELDTTSELPYYNRGNLLKANQRWQGSIHDYNKALIKRASFAEAYNNRGISKVMLADSVGALKDFETAVMLKPSDQMFVNNLNRLKGEISN
jgi:tetratricopeptide (TPR) repeat protein